MTDHPGHPGQSVPALNTWVGAVRRDHSVVSTLTHPLLIFSECGTDRVWWLDKSLIQLTVKLCGQQRSVVKLLTHSTPCFRSTSHWDAASSTRNCRRTDCPGSGCSQSRMYYVFGPALQPTPTWHTLTRQCRCVHRETVWFIWDVGGTEMVGWGGGGVATMGISPWKPRRQVLATPLFTQIWPD